MNKENAATNINTALISAAACGNLDTARFLVEIYGANVNAVNESGDTALSCAKKYGYNEVVQYLSSL